MRHICHLLVATYYANGEWWIVEGGQSNQRRIVEQVQKAQQTGPNCKVMDDQIEFKVLWICLEEFEPL